MESNSRANAAAAAAKATNAQSVDNNAMAGTGAPNNSSRKDLTPENVPADMGKYVDGI